MATPHNEANDGQIAKTVLMPGDPLRAKFIAETFLKDCKTFNTVRNMFGYTGTYEGKEVSVMGSGMGMPSIGIYSYELFKEYGVEQIIRIGSAGSYSKEAKIFDVVLATGAYSESSFAKTMSGYDKDMTYPDDSLNAVIEQCAGELDIALLKGNIHSSDVFYRQAEPGYYEKIRDEKGCLAVEMESFALFHNARVLGKKAACLLTISDSFVDSKETTSEEREKCFTDMMHIALRTAVYCDKQWDKQCDVQAGAKGNAHADMQGV